MKDEYIVVEFDMVTRNKKVDLEIPLFISANELIIALNNAYNLEMDIDDIKNCFLKAENPIALLKGNRKLYDFGLRMGSIIKFTD